MSIEEIMRLAVNLGEAINQSNEVNEMKEIQNKLTQDPAALELISRFQEAQTKHNNKMNDGILITPADEEELNKIEEEIGNNPLLQELVQVQEKFDTLMQGVYFAMNQAIAGEIPEGGCSGSCSSCGGSCTM